MGVARTGVDRDTDSSSMSFRRFTQFLGPDRIDDCPPFTPKRVRCVASISSLIPSYLPDRSDCYKPALNAHSEPGESDVLRTTSFFGITVSFNIHEREDERICIVLGPILNSAPPSTP